MRNSTLRAVAALIVIAFYGSIAIVASAQTPPLGMDVVNLARSGTALTPSDTTVFAPTKFLYIAGTGAGAVCNAAVLFSGDSSSVTLLFLQPGRVYPLSITKLLATATTCVASIALR